MPYFSVLWSWLMQAHSHPNRSSKWTQKSPKRHSNKRSFCGFISVMKVTGVWNACSIIWLFMLNAVVFIFLVVAYVCIRIPILTGVQNKHISRRKDSVFLLKMFFLKLVFHDVGHLYAKCLFYILTIYAKSLIYQFLSCDIRMHIPILTGVQNEPESHRKDSVFFFFAKECSF